MAETRLAERRQEKIVGRIKREAMRREAKIKTARQPALNLAEGEYQLPPLGLLAEPVRQHDATALTDDALEENARMLEAVLARFRREGPHRGGTARARS